MENYELKNDEVVLYRGNVLFLDGKKEKVSSFKNVVCELALSNLNVIFTTKTKKMFQKEMIETEIYPIEHIKIYQERPHIMLKGKNVEISFIGTEKLIEFPDKKEAKLFSDTALRLITGNSKFVRGVKKAQKEVEETSNALNIDIVGMAKAAVGVATNLAVENAAVAGASKGSKFLGMLAKNVKKKKENQPLLTATTDDTVKKLKEIKELLDEGIITQEEFEKMKKECLGNIE